MPNRPQTDELQFGAVTLFVTLGVLTVIALLATAFTDDPAFRFHGTILLIAGVLSLGACAALGGGRV